MADPVRPTLTLQNKGQQPEPSKAAQPAGEDITYLPGVGDPAETTWRGRVFKANVPTRIVDQDHIESARGNPFFRVGSEAAPVDPNKAPATPIEYRAHAVAWLREAMRVNDLIAHWASERNLRASCEVGSDDTDYLGTILEPKLTALARTEGLSDQQVAQIWIRHGVLELPWRS